MKTVLQKYIADSGYCSRRQAEELIRHGEVFVNDEQAELGMRVDDGDKIEIDGFKIKGKVKNIYIILNKPIGYTCTNRMFKDEDNIFDLVKVDERLFAVGRLDKDSRGLVLLTNDGELTQKLTHPSHESEKKYLAEVSDKNIDYKTIQTQMKRGVDIGDGDGIVKAKKIKYIGDNKFEVVLTEGKNRQIRRMLGRLDCNLVDLCRIEIGKIKMGSLEEGRWREINLKEII